MFRTWLKKHMPSHIYFNLSIRNRLLLYFITLFLLPTSVITTTVYFKSTSIITDKTNNSLKNSLNLIENDIQQKLDGIYDNIITNIYLNQDIMRILSTDRPAGPTNPTTQTDIVNEMNTIDKVLESYQTRNLGENIIVPKLYMNNRPEYLMYNFSDKVSDVSVIEREPWYLDMPAELKYEIVGLNKTMVSSVSLNTIKIAARMFGIHNIDIPYEACLTVDVGIDSFNNIMNSFKPTANSQIFIIDENDNVVLSPDKSILYNNLSELEYIKQINNASSVVYKSLIEKFAGEDNLISYKKFKSINWTIIVLSPMRELNGELITLNRNIVIVLSLCTILALALVLFLADNISYPIRKLAKSMSSIQNGNFDIKIEYKRNDEFSYLIRIYKEMVNRIKELIEKLYTSEVRKKEAELKSLQAQINPHFLYNTLDSVNWLAMKYKVPDISTMVTSLSDFFRYSLSKGHDIISLGDEIRQVQSYLVIQSIRFKDKLEYFIDVPEEIKQYSTIKLILQPIVENSIIHGIEKRKGKGTITISGMKSEDAIEIFIVDNGVNADIEALNYLLNNDNTTNAYGIRNVNERIKFTFGEQYGLSFANNPSGGVTATIRIPAAIKTEGSNA